MDWINVITLALLAIDSWGDLRSREIYLFPTVIYGIAGIILKFCMGQSSLYELIIRIIPGFFLLLVGKVSGEKIGYGDGLVILTLGIWIGFTDCLLTLTGGLLLAFIFSVTFLTLRKFKGGTQLPFIPFLLISYIGRLFVQ